MTVQHVIPAPHVAPLQVFIVPVSSPEVASDSIPPSFAPPFDEDDELHAAATPTMRETASPSLIARMMTTSECETPKSRGDPNIGRNHRGRLLDGRFMGIPRMLRRRRAASPRACARPFAQLAHACAHFRCSTDSLADLSTVGSPTARGQVVPRAPRQVELVSQYGLDGDAAARRREPLADTEVQLEPLDRNEVDDLEELLLLRDRPWTSYAPSSDPERPLLGRRTNRRWETGETLQSTAWAFVGHCDVCFSGGRRRITVRTSHEALLLRWRLRRLGPLGCPLSTGTTSLGSDASIPPTATRRFELSRDLQGAVGHRRWPQRSSTLVRPRSISSSFVDSGGPDALGHMGCVLTSPLATASVAQDQQQERDARNEASFAELPCALSI